MSCVFCFLKHMFHNFNEYGEDHPNYVFSQVILCSMCTARGNVTGDGEDSTEKKPTAGGGDGTS